MKIDALDRIDFAIKRAETYFEAAKREDGRGAHSSAVLGIESIAQPITDEVQGKEGGGEKKGREDQEPGRPFHIVASLRDEHAPAGHRLLHAQTEKGQEAFENDYLGYQQRHVDDDRTKEVWNDVAQEYAGTAYAQRLGGLHIFLAFDRQCLAAHDARHVEPQDGSHRQEHQHEIAPEKHDQHDDEKDERQ